MVCELSHPTQSHRAVRFRRTVARMLVVAAGMALVATKGLTRVVVSGDSMSPAFQPDDRLVLVPAVRLRPGHVVGVADPREPQRLLVKRVRSIEGELVEVMGDNETRSTDSRHFGAVPRRSIVGRAAYRYAPPGRAGRLKG